METMEIARLSALFVLFLAIYSVFIRFNLLYDSVYAE